jgi:hypothetical protein
VQVITTYGRGEVLSFRESDTMYAVKLPFGIAYLAPSAIYGSEQLSANALYVSALVLLALKLCGAGQCAL